MGKLCTPQVALSKRKQANAAQKVFVNGKPSLSSITELFLCTTPVLRVKKAEATIPDVAALICDAVLMDPQGLSLSPELLQILKNPPESFPEL